MQIRMQCHNDLIRTKKINVPYTGVTDAAKRISATEGLWGFWKGNLSGIASKGINNFFIVAYRDVINRKVELKTETDHKTSSIWLSALAPLLTLIPIIVTYPFDYARTRLANNGLMEGTKPQFSGYGDLFKKTWAVEGY